MSIHTGDDIQEQLRLQREQQKRQKEQKQGKLKQGEQDGDIAPEDEQTGPLSVEGFVFDKERNAYFPVGCSENDIKHPIKNSDPDKNPYSVPRRRLHSAPFIPIQCLDNGSFPSETNTSRWRWLTPFMAPAYMNPSRPRQSLVASWGARTLFSRWEVLERHSQMPPGLSHVADWCRSMDACKNEDIVSLSDDIPAQMFSGLNFSNSTNCGDPLSDFYNVRVLPNQYIALFESLPSSKCSIVRLYKRDSFSHESTFDFLIPDSVNDVVGLKCQVILAACSTQKSRGRSCLYCAYPSGAFVDGTQQSDALCLEELGSQEALVGHRNGQVSIYDVRQSKTAAVFQSIEQSGNVVRMQLLPNSSSVLLQSSHPDHGGRISMLDVRGTTHDNLVWSAASSNGRGKRGMTILSNTLVVVPGSDMNGRGKTGCNVLDVWSLADGNMVGSFPLERKLDAEPHLMVEVAAANRKIYVRTWGEHSSDWTVLAERQLCSLKGSECLGGKGEGDIAI